MTGINNYSQFLNLNSKRQIQATPAEKKIEEALGGIENEKPENKPSEEEIKQDVKSWMELDSQMMVKMNNIKIVSRAKSRPIDASAINQLRGGSSAATMGDRIVTEESDITLNVINDDKCSKDDVTLKSQEDLHFEKADNSDVNFIDKNSIEWTEETQKRAENLLNEIINSNDFNRFEEFADYAGVKITISGDSFNGYEISIYYPNGEEYSTNITDSPEINEFLQTDLGKAIFVTEDNPAENIPTVAEIINGPEENGEQKNAKYTLDDLKNEYNLANRDIIDFFEKNNINNKYSINQDIVKSIFGKDDITTVEQLMDAIENIGFTKEYIQTNYGFSEEQIEKYLTVKSENPKRYVLNQDAVKADFEDKEIKSLGQLKININPEIGDFVSFDDIDGYSENAKRYNLSSLISPVRNQLKEYAKAVLGDKYNDVMFDDMYKYTLNELSQEGGFNVKEAVDSFMQVFDNQVKGNSIDKPLGTETGAKMGIDYTKIKGYAENEVFEADYTDHQTTTKTPEAMRELAKGTIEFLLRGIYQDLKNYTQQELGEFCNDDILNYMIQAAVEDFVDNKSIVQVTNTTFKYNIKDVIDEFLSSFDSIISPISTLINDIKELSKSKDVEQTEFVLSRLVPFMTMRAENPNITLDEMEEIYRIRNCANDSSIVVEYLLEKFPSLFESGVLDNEVCNQIAQKSTAILFANRANLPVDETTFLKICFEAQATLIDTANFLGFDVDSYVDTYLPQVLEQRCNNAGNGTTRGTLPDNIKQTLYDKYGSNIKFSTINDGIVHITNGKDNIGTITIYDDDGSILVETKDLDNPYTSTSLYYDRYGEQYDWFNETNIIPNDFWNYAKNNDFDIETTLKELQKCNDTRNLRDTLRNLFNNHNNFAKDLLEDCNDESQMDIFLKQINDLTDYYNLNIGLVYYDISQYSSGDVPISNKDYANIILQNIYFSTKINPDKHLSVSTEDLDGNISTTGTSQGSVGDCWFLSGILSCTNSQDLINALKDRIFIDRENGVAGITIQGKTYAYSIDDILRNTNLSSGDLDLRLLEMAAKEYFYATNPSGLNPIGFGGNMDYLLDFLCGNSTQSYAWYSNDDKYGTEGLTWERVKELPFIIAGLFGYNKAVSHMQSGEYLSTISTKVKGLKILDSKGNEIDFITHHAYSVVGADDKYIYLKNPHNTNETLRLPIDTFMKQEFLYREVEFSDLLEAINNPSNNQDNTSTNNLEGNVLSFEDIERNNYLTNVDNFIAENANDPSSQDFIQFMQNWYRTSNNYNWTTMIIEYTKQNPNKVVVMPDGSAAYQGGTYGSLAIWSYMNGDKYAVKVDENGNVTFATKNGKTDATQIDEIVCIGKLKKNNGNQSVNNNGSGDNGNSGNHSDSSTSDDDNGVTPPVIPGTGNYGDTDDYEDPDDEARLNDLLDSGNYANHWSVTVGGYTVHYFDIDGDGEADIEIEIT